MKNAVDTTIRGIKCDNPNCDFSDMSVSFENYKEYVNRPCPKCGCNLLTEHDYNVCKAMMKMTGWLNKLIKVSDDYDGSDDVKMEVNLNGTDSTTFKVTPANTFKEKPSNEVLHNHFNKTNAAWLEQELIAARKANKTKNINDLDTNVLSCLVNGYSFNIDCLAFFFNSDRKEVMRICRDKGVRFDSVAAISFKLTNNTIYDVDTIYKNCII